MQSLKLLTFCTLHFVLEVCGRCGLGGGIGLGGLTDFITSGIGVFVPVLALLVVVVLARVREDVPFLCFVANKKMEIAKFYFLVAKCSLFLCMGAVSFVKCVKFQVWVCSACMLVLSCRC